VRGRNGKCPRLRVYAIMKVFNVEDFVV